MEWYLDSCICKPGFVNTNSKYFTLNCTAKSDVDHVIDERQNNNP